MKKLLIGLNVVFFLFIGYNSGSNGTDAQVKVLNLRQGINSKKVAYDGLSREVFILLPTNYNTETTYPVVFFFHGLGGVKEWGKEVLQPFVESDNIIGISPQGIENSWNTGGGEVPSTADDVGFTLEILNLLEREVILDNSRIYSMGYSNGGAFSYTLALMTDKFAAVSSVSASLFEGKTIDPTVHKLSVFQIHGDLDTVVPYNGGQSSALTISFESALHTVELWAQHNGITGNPEIGKPEEKITSYTFNLNNS